MTHIMTGCCKYEKDGTPKKGFQGKAFKKGKKPENISFAQLSECFMKLEKVLKKQQKKSLCKRCHYKSDSSDSNLE